MSREIEWRGTASDGWDAFLVNPYDSSAVTPFRIVVTDEGEFEIWRTNGTEPIATRASFREAEIAFAALHEKAVRNWHAQGEEAQCNSKS